MKPKDLIPPFSKGADWHIVIKDKVWYVPIKEDKETNFSFPGWEHADLFGNSNPVHVEYCSGNGKWIAEKARENPHINWVAVEIKFKRVRKIWSKLNNYNLSNLVILCGEGLWATQKFIPSESVSQVYINFPDPWPKRRHGKNRLVESPFVEEVRRIIKGQGDFTLVTDDPDYSMQMIKVLKSNEKFSSRYPEPHFVTECEGYGNSYFEDLWREKGKEIRYHRFQKEA